MKTLASYLKDAKISQVQFAKIIGVKQPTVHRWLNGARPSWDAAFKIQKATKGEVSIGAWERSHIESTPKATARTG